MHHALISYLVLMALVYAALLVIYAWRHDASGIAAAALFAAAPITLLIVGV